MRIKDHRTPKGRHEPSERAWTLDTFIGSWPFGTTADGGGWGNGDGHANLFKNKTRIVRHRKRSWQRLVCVSCEKWFQSAARNAKYCGPVCYREAQLTRKRAARAA